MILGYSTLGQPELSFDQCDNLAREFGLDFLELRVLENTMDLPAYFQARNVEAFAMPVRVLDSSLRLTEVTPEKLDEFIRFAQLAERMRVPYIRVFGGGCERDLVTPEQYQLAADTVNRIREMARANAWNFEMLLETHSAFSFPDYCQKLNDFLSEPLHLLWDSHHTWKVAGETLEESWKKLGPWVRHVHYKDSIAEGEKYHYVLPGEGDFPSSTLFELLREKGYTGGVSLEWEKYWHKELPPLRSALEKFRKIAC